MRLTDLDPKFLHFVSEREFKCVDAIGEADGVEFLCQKCFVARGPDGTHRVICWSPKVPLNPTERDDARFLGLPRISAKGQGTNPLARESASRGRSKWQGSR